MTSSHPFYQTPHMRLNDLDSEAQLWTLGAERRTVIKSLDSTTCPILTLPPEITALIFSHCIGTPHIGYRADPRVRDRGPLLLMSVCRHWRDLCLSICSLWASLHVHPRTFSTTEKSPTYGLAILLQGWLSRSGNLPLDLWMDEPRFSHAGMSACLAVLPPFLPRLRRLELQLSSDTCAHFPHDEFRGRVPNLVKLSLQMLQYRRSESHPPDSWTAFSEAPQLREVQLDFMVPRVVLPWSQLTELSFSNGSVGQCMKRLHQTPQLEILSISSLALLEEQLPRRLPAFQHLHTLRIIFCDTDWLLVYLTLPVLKTLEIGGMSFERINLTNLHALSARSQWSLRTMRLHELTGPTALACLEDNLHLEELSIRFLGWGDADASSLFGRLGDGLGFLPHLRALTIGNCIIDERLTVEAVAQIVERRWGSNRLSAAQLESFQLSFHENVKVDIVEELKGRLRSIMDEGFNLVVTK